MGTGIAAAIPLVFKQYEGRKLDEEYFAKGFLENFDVEEVGTKKIYSIKKDLLINNYKSFLTEFYDLIDEDFHEETELDPDSIPLADNLDEFLQLFNCDNRNGSVPFVEESSYAFSVLGCECKRYWLFYNGSYKAILEEYSTLLHFEKILAKAMKNPLGTAVKFGIYG
jgi:hypothetical protein